MVTGQSGSPSGVSTSNPCRVRVKTTGCACGRRGTPAAVADFERPQRRRARRRVRVLVVGRPMADLDQLVDDVGALLQRRQVGRVFGDSSSIVQLTALRAMVLKPSASSTPAATLSWLPRIVRAGQAAHAIDHGVGIGAVADQVAEHERRVIARGSTAASTASSASMLPWMSLRIRYRMSRVQCGDDLLDQVADAGAGGVDSKVGLQVGQTPRGIEPLELVAVRCQRPPTVGREARRSLRRAARPARRRARRG